MCVCDIKLLYIGIIRCTVYEPSERCNKTQHDRRCMYIDIILFFRREKKRGKNLRLYII